MVQIFSIETKPLALAGCVFHTTKLQPKEKEIYKQRLEERKEQGHLSKPDA